MKNRFNITGLLIFCLLGISSLGYPIEDFASFSPVEPPEEIIRNPFIPQLPVEEVEVEADTIDMATTENEPQAGEDDSDFSYQEEIEVIAPDLIISGLVWNTDQPQAIVNQTIVNLGDTIEGAIVEEIHQDGIVITYEGVQFTIEKDSSIDLSSDN